MSDKHRITLKQKLLQELFLFSMNKKARLNSKNKLETPSSGTTIAIDYSAKDKLLEVQFLPGKVYHYKKVEPDIWRKYKEIVISGGSSGLFVNTEVKPFYEYYEVPI